MFLSKIEMIFFMIVLVSTILFSILSLSMGPKLCLNKTVIITVLSMVMTIILVLVYKYCKVGCSSKGESYQFFEVTPEKVCGGGPYMISSAPQKVKDYCNNLWSTKKGKKRHKLFNCGSGFHGRPVHFEYTSMSNDDWKNEMCTVESDHDSILPL